MLYEMACGQTPFEARSPIAMMTRQVLETAKPPSAVRPGVPDMIDEIVARCMAKEPEDRYQIADEILDDFETLSEDLARPDLASVLDAGERYDGESAIPVSRRAFGDAEIQAEAEAEAAVTELLPQLGRAYKSFMLYPRDNPIFERAADAMTGHLDRYFAIHERLPMTVDRFAIFYRKKKVYEETDLRISYPFRLFSDGIRRLFFHKGLTREEVLDYFDCLDAVAKGGGLTSDLVTLMWERKFRHISFHLVEDLIEDSLPDTGALASGWHGTDREGDEGGDQTRAKSGERTATSSVAELTAEDHDTLRAAIEVETSSENMGEFIVALLAVMHRSSDPREQIAIARVLSESLQGLLNLRDTRHVLVILLAVRKIVEKGTSDEELAQELEAIRKIASEPRHVEGMLDTLDTPRSASDRKRVGRYLTLLEPDVAVPLVVDRLDRVDEETLPVLQMSLLVLSKDESNRLKAGLEHARPKVVRATIDVVRKTTPEVAVPLITPLLEHPDADVRVRTVAALAAIGPPRLFRTLEPFLRDADLRVREATLAAFGSMKPSDARGPLVALIEDRRFLLRSHSEQAQVFKALALAGGNEVVEGLERLLDSIAGGRLRGRIQKIVVALLVGGGVLVGIAQLIGVLLTMALVILAGAVLGLGAVELGLLRTAHAEELIEPVALCLARIGTPEARKILTERSHHGPKKVRRICERVLKKREGAEQ